MYADDTTIYFNNLEDFDSNNFEFEINAELQKVSMTMNDYDYEMVLLRHTISTMYHGIIFKSCKKHNILQ